MLVPAVLPALVLLYFVYGWLLLLVAWATLMRRGVVGILVYSESPHWHEHVREVWLPRLGDRVVVLNWLERRHWGRGLSVRLFDHFMGRQENFNPSVLLFRGLRSPLRFRFFYAFRDARHGNRQALERLEERLWAEIERRSPAADSPSRS